MLWFCGLNFTLGPPSVGVESGAKCTDGQNWVCEHRWQSIANMVAWRNAAGTSDISNWVDGDTGNQIAFSRGNAAFLAMNRGSYDWNIDNIDTGLPEGTYCNVLNSGADADDADKCSATVFVDSSGKASNVNVPALGAVALHIAAAK